MKVFELIINSTGKINNFTLVNNTSSENNLNSNMATEVINIPSTVIPAEVVVTQPLQPLPPLPLPEYKYIYDYGSLPWVFSWPSIVMIIIGLVLVIYALVDSSIDNDRRVLGIILILLWTALWALLLWVLWKNGRRQTAWWLLLIPSISIIIFFVLVLILNLGS